MPRRRHTFTGMGRFKAIACAGPGYPGLATTGCAVCYFNDYTILVFPSKLWPRAGRTPRHPLNDIIKIPSWRSPASPMAESMPNYSVNQSATGSRPFRLCPTLPLVTTPSVGGWPSDRALEFSRRLENLSPRASLGLALAPLEMAQQPRVATALCLPAHVQHGSGLLPAH
jgi:hypothetical protein